MCCDRLATLINRQGDGIPLGTIEAETGPLDHAFLIRDLRSNWSCRTEAEIAAAMSGGYAEPLKNLREDAVVEGLVIFQCRILSAIGFGLVGGRPWHRMPPLVLSAPCNPPTRFSSQRWLSPDAADQAPRLS